MFLFETLVNSNKIESLRVKLGFNNAMAIDREGRGGGMAVFWNVMEKVTILSFSQHHIDLDIEDEARGRWSLTSFYGMPQRSRC